MGLSMLRAQSVSLDIWSKAFCRASLPLDHETPGNRAFRVAASKLLKALPNQYLKHIFLRHPFSRL